MQTISRRLISAFLAQEQLPDSYGDAIQNWYLPLINRLLTLHQNNGPGLLVGINGAQGTGKSTLANLLTMVLQQQNLKVANFSLDDFYLSHESRARLADEVHPLLATRGVPGTHDLESMQEVVNVLVNPESTGTIKIPRFDKALDNPKPEDQWDSVDLPVDVILFEGWFVGIEPQNEVELADPVNELEAEQDTDGNWRRYVNNRLEDYQALFSQIEFLIMLQAPSFERVYKWRRLQEEKLAASVDQGDNRIMDAESLRRFIQHFERLSRHALETLPARADLVFNLDDSHQIVSMSQAVH